VIVRTATPSTPSPSGAPSRPGAGVRAPWPLLAARCVPPSTERRTHRECRRSRRGVAGCRRRISSNAVRPKWRSTRRSRSWRPALLRLGCFIGDPAHAVKLSSGWTSRTKLRAPSTSFRMITSTSRILARIAHDCFGTLLCSIDLRSEQASSHERAESIGRSGAVKTLLLRIPRIRRASDHNLETRSRRVRSGCRSRERLVEEIAEPDRRRWGDRRREGLRWPDPG